ncbi:putative glucomannan 4-beta-mannosyltransferase 1-like [Cocos nucifera]|uniref:Putative glucomannan 4-beta-mannosyltransferase 1-like n=1 Tax=Cocos nucifera TaxID=13894 RepID=A0A8K0I9K1_COCNU|nr:putative glucomannan 4-beta-mannosyltransferase 1-like [Cocos nucifera]
MSAQNVLPRSIHIHDGKARLLGIKRLEFPAKLCTTVGEEKAEVMEAKSFHSPSLSIARVSELLFSSTTTAFLPEQISVVWRQFRAFVVVPIVKAAVIACLIMSTMMLVEKVSMGLVSLYAKVFRRRPERIYKCDPIAQDEELVTLAYPMVLVQIPMYNEKEVYRLSIGAACSLIWPDDRILIQVLDDSTDPVVKDLVKKECEKWFKKGKNIKYETRDNRSGYKAGALKVGMKYGYVETCEYIAMFDADFQPSPDFLTRTVPFLEHNADIALVQARWQFGGWKDRTTVEDMDLAVRAGLGGWKFVYVGNVKVKSELPSTFKAYRYQQHRWACGPAVLFRKMFWDIVKTKKVSIWKKLHVIYNFFLARRIISHFVTFFFYCVVIPFSVFFPEVEIPKWGMVYVPTTITLLNSVGTPRNADSLKHLSACFSFHDQISSSSIFRFDQEHFYILVLVDISKVLEVFCDKIVYSKEVEILEFSHGSPPLLDLSLQQDNEDQLPLNDIPANFKLGLRMDTADDGGDSS